MSPLSDKLRFKLSYDFLWLLIALSLLVFIPSFIPTGLAKNIIIYITLVLAILFSIISTASTKQDFYFSASLAFFAIVANAIPVVDDNLPMFLARMGALIVFFSYVSLTVLYRLANARKVSLNIIFGAIAGYLLMGVLGGFWCRLIEFLYPNSFLMPMGVEARVDTLTYFSFVTMCSLGYGDITPITAPGRSTSIFIAITGQMYLAITIAFLVGSYARSSKRE